MMSHVLNKQPWAMPSVSNLNEEPKKSISPDMDHKNATNSTTTNVHLPDNRVFVRVLHIAKILVYCNSSIAYLVVAIPVLTADAC